MITIHQETRKALDRARQMVSASLDVAQVPDGHPIEEKMNSAFVGLEEVMEEIPKAGVNAAALNHESPAIRVIPNKDMRVWKTTDHGLAGDDLYSTGSKTAKKLVASGRRLVMPTRFANRRMISSKEYLEALESDGPIESPFSNASYSMVQLAPT